MNKKKLNNSIVIKSLIKKINYHDNLYYNKNYQEISDEEYDELRRKLSELETTYPNLKFNNSPNIRVGTTVEQNLKTYKHLTPMLSLNNAYTVKEVSLFYERLLKKISLPFNIIAETKVDGLSASLRYSNRRLNLALTRGDGFKGEDITKNIKYVKGVKKYLPENFPPELEIRGEIFMEKKIFQQLNEDRKKKGYNLFSTPRNAAAGSIRQLDPIITKNRKLSFYGYTLITKEYFSGNTISSTREELEKNLFSLNKPSKVCKSLKEMIDFHSYISKIREKLNYDIDGIVYKVDSYEEQKKLGYNNRFPRWALAHKFPAETAYTKLKKVDFQVGRTGTITPVAILKEVNIGGVKISRATLHNFDEIKRLDLMIGDTVSIKRAGDVIPKIISIVKEKRKNSNEIILPTYCPVCNTLLEKKEHETAVRCPNIFGCREQAIHRIIHFTSRNAFNIEGLGDSQIRIFWELNIIKNFKDIFLLEERFKNKLKALEDIDGFGKKSVQNLLKSINNSKIISFEKFIFALGIRNVGQGVSNLLSKKFIDINEFILFFKNINEENTIKIEGIGDTILESIKFYINKSQNSKMIYELINLIEIKYDKELKITKFTGKNFVLTGTFENFKRKEIESKLKNSGALVKSSISNNTDFLLAGSNPGSKLIKADKLGVSVISLAEIIELL